MSSSLLLQERKAVKFFPAMATHLCVYSRQYFWTQSTQLLKDLPNARWEKLMSKFLKNQSNWLRLSLSCGMSFWTAILTNWSNMVSIRPCFPAASWMVGVAKWPDKEASVLIVLSWQKEKNVIEGEKTIMLIYLTVGFLICFLKPLISYWLSNNQLSYSVNAIPSMKDKDFERSQ